MFGAVSAKATLSETDQSVQRSKPPAALFILTNRDYTAVRQLLSKRVCKEFPVFEFTQTDGRSDPERSFAIFKQRLDRLVGNNFARGKVAAPYARKPCGCRDPQIVVAVFVKKIDDIGE